MMTQWEMNIKDISKCMTILKHLRSETLKSRRTNYVQIDPGPLYGRRRTTTLSSDIKRAFSLKNVKFVHRVRYSSAVTFKIWIALRVSIIPAIYMTQLFAFFLK